MQVQRYEKQISWKPPDVRNILGQWEKFNVDHTLDGISWIDVKFVCDDSIAVM